MSEQWLSSEEIELCELRDELARIKAENERLRQVSHDNAQRITTAASLLTLAQVAQCVHETTRLLAATEDEAALGFEIEERIRRLPVRRSITAFTVQNEQPMGVQ